MALPPERISIKRRRGDEPVDTLVLERDKKRRFTDFIFRRLPNEQIDLGSKTQPPVPQNSTVDAVGTVTTSRQGIPTVKATKPGDETADFSKYREIQKERQSGQEAKSLISTSKSAVDASQNETSIESDRPSRRFHLTRDLSSALKPHTSSGIRKSKWFIRPPLPTFIERRQTASDQSRTADQATPIDRILEFKTTKESATTQGSDNINFDAQSSTKTQVPTFVPSKISQIKSGRSIRDDPHTWDLESDQLADELAALAMEMDPVTNVDLMEDIKAHTVAKSGAELANPNVAILGDEYVYETYVRVRLESEATSRGVIPSEFGYLVIDEEDNDLWEQYIRDEEDDDEWDEEDEDSNAEDNPRNDYPEDEVSSDDEFDRNVYKYRANASEDEEFGDD